MKRTIDFKSKNEYDAYMVQVAAKIEANEDLTKEEISNYCFALPYDKKKNYSFCDNDRFEYLYLHKLDNGRTRPKLTENQLNDFKEFIDSWKQFLDSKNYTNRAEQYLIEEHKEQIRALNKEYNTATDISTTNSEYNEKLNEIIAYNKYIYINGQRIFTEYRFPIEMKLSNRDIFIDEKIFFHSMLRHYGQVTKQIRDNKSYFTEDILVEEIFQKVIEFLTKIEAKSIIVENDISIRVLFKSVPYQIYTLRIPDNRGTIKYRVNSFFPIEDPDKLRLIKEEYEVIEIDLELGYLKKK
ncbi:MAG: hypothetical protein JXA68_03675 [Ignavibacteriales bacterium]|nr:hypothetical protein [Ignavibacteriales bacterium]